MGWLVFEGENGIDFIFDEVQNKSKKHRRDDALIPFKTKVDKNRYEDFSGVVGAFSRLLSDTTLKGGVSKELLYEGMRAKVEDCSDEMFGKLFQIVESVYFDNEELLPVNARALSYINSNITQQQVAEYLYSLFIKSSDLKEKYGLMEHSEDTNVLERLVFSSLEDSESKYEKAIENADCFLPYVREVFYNDFSTLLNDIESYKTYIERFLAYYYMFYISQLAVKLYKFEKGRRDEIEKIYMTLNWEVVTRVRPGYEYGWRYVKEKLSHMFSHAVVLEMMSHNVENIHLDYIGLYGKMLGNPIDEQTAIDVNGICNTYTSWIPLDYSACKHDSEKDGDCKTSNSVRRLFELVDYQFINGGRTSHYNGYNKKFIDFVQHNFAKWRGTLGYSMGVNESDIVMFTQIILKQNDNKIRLSKLFEEFEKRGLLFDRESKRRITELFEKMNLLEKRSDSGDAQYVKSVL